MLISEELISPGLPSSELNLMGSTSKTPSLKQRTLEELTLAELKDLL
jgi:hypothetical protein